MRRLAAACALLPARRRPTRPPCLPWAQLALPRFPPRSLLQDGKHGQVWGKLTWKGQQQNEQARQIHGPLKRVWRVLDVPAAAAEQQQWQSLAAAALQKEAAAAAAAEQAAPAAEATA